MVASAKETTCHCGDALSLSWKDGLENGMQPTPVFLPGEFLEWRSLVGYSPRGHKELNMTEAITLSLFLKKILANLMVKIILPT